MTHIRREQPGAFLKIRDTGSRSSERPRHFQDVIESRPVKYPPVGRTQYRWTRCEVDAVLRGRQASRLVWRLGQTTAVVVHANLAAVIQHVDVGGCDV